MVRRFGFRYQVVSSFFASLLVGYWMRPLDNGEERLRMTVLGNLFGTLGMVFGYKLAERSSDAT